MIKNRLKHKAAGILAAFFMIGTVAGAVWADPVPEETTPSEEMTVEETQPVETEPVETEPPVIPEESGEPVDPISFGLTPDGNMSLQDDIAGEEAESIEFLTVTTRDNHTFYIVIEHMKSGDNVHFLNQVDNADLMAIMSDEEAEQYFPDGVPEETTETPSVLDENGEPDVTEADGTAVTKKESKVNFGSLKTLLVVVGIVGAIGGGYYFVKIKPKKDGKINEDAEFEDDEEFPEETENEDEAESYEETQEEESEE